MKKYLVMTASVSIALASCTKNEVDVPSFGEDKVIAFAAPVVGSNTREVDEVGGTYPTTNAFNVWAHYYGDGGYNNFAAGKLHIDEATAVYDATGDTWYPKDGENYYYWPKNGSLTFIAYSPATDYIKNLASVDAKGITFSDYIVYTAVGEQVDLLYSERQYDEVTTSGITTPYKGTDVVFNHALSSIVFNAKLDKQYPGMTVKLKGIKFTNVANKATFCQNLTDSKGLLTKTPAALADISNNQNLSDELAAWTTADSREVYSVADAEYTLDNSATPTAYWPCTKSASSPDDTKTANVRKTDLILIPQKHNKADDDKISLTINYSIQSSNGVEIDQVYTKDLGTGEWKIGYRYKYNVEFGFDPITLAPTVNVWADADAISPNIKEYQ